MRVKLPYKTKQFFFVAIKLAIVLGAIYFIYERLAKSEIIQSGSFLSSLKDNEIFSFDNLLILAFLSFINLFLESLKWQQLVTNISSISLSNAIKQTFVGLTASQITPQRIGDYGAKILYFKPNLRAKVAVLNFISHSAQMIITIVFGLVGLLFLIYNYDLNINYYRILKVLVIFTTLFAVTIFGLGNRRIRFKGYSLKSVWSQLASLPTQLKMSCIGLSLLRYLIFSFQYYFLLLIFGVEIDYLFAMTFITSMYLIASIIPVMNIFDVIIKGSVAVFLFSFISIDELTILSITTIMWFLNVVLPSLFGSYCLLNYKLPLAEA